MNLDKDVSLSLLLTNSKISTTILLPSDIVILHCRFVNFNQIYLKRVFSIIFSMKLFAESVDLPFAQYTLSLKSQSNFTAILTCYLIFLNIISIQIFGRVQMLIWLKMAIGILCCLSTILQRPNELDSWRRNPTSWVSSTIFLSCWEDITKYKFALFIPILIGWTHIQQMHISVARILLDCRLYQMCNNKRE